MAQCRLFPKIYRFRQSVDPGTVHEQVENVKASGQRIICAVKIGSGFTLFVQLSNTRIGADDKFVHLSEPDRIGRTGLGACGLQPLADAIIAECALPGNLQRATTTFAILFTFLIFGPLQINYLINN